MKFNKLTIGLGVLASMLVSCDKAAEQDYTPAPPVAVPAAYFALDYDGDVVIDENQTSFTVPIYRGTTAGEQTVDVTCRVNGNYFTIEGKKVVADGDNGSLTFPVVFKEGEDALNMTIEYPWEDMNANPGKEYLFQFSVPGETTDYFTTATTCSAMFVPWQTIVGPKGETAGTFIDELIYTAWSVDEPFEYEVEIQSNPVNENVFRINTPYANCPANSPGNQQMQYMGGDIVNYMYINAKDASNVYLCDKSGAPRPVYDTYYTIDRDYGNVSYWDRAAGSILGQTFQGVNPAGYSAATYETQTVDGKVYPNRIVFPEDHFYVYFGEYTQDGNKLEIRFPGGSGPKEWNDLGSATYTDGLLSCANGEDAISYEVPIQQNTENPAKYRLINPYTNYWPAGNPQDQDYDITIDCSDANFVIVEQQATGNWVSEGRDDYAASIFNAAILYTEVLPDKRKKTKEQIIAEGLNDTFVDGVIKLPNATIGVHDAEGYLTDAYVASDMGWPGCQVVLPKEDAAKSANYVVAAARNNSKGLTYSKKTIKSGNTIKAIRKFDVNLRNHK